MECGRQSLLLEIARRHAVASGDRAVLAAIPAPPGPTFPDTILRRRRAPR